jgi:molecular chaperone GrpE
MSENVGNPPSGPPEEGEEPTTAVPGEDPGLAVDPLEEPAHPEVVEAEMSVGLEDPLDPLTAMTLERDEYLDTLRRVQADFENYKKRVVRQQAEQLDRAAEGLVNKLIPALDTLELAVSHHPADTEAGSVLSQVSSALYEALSREGLEKVAPLDQEFDPNEAEAVMHEPAEEGQAAHVVVEVLRPGFKWRGRVLRPAMVKVRG